MKEVKPRIGRLSRFIQAVSFLTHPVFFLITQERIGQFLAPLTPKMIRLGAYGYNNYTFHLDVGKNLSVFPMDMTQAAWHFRAAILDEVPLNAVTSTVCFPYRKVL